MYNFEYSEFICFFMSKEIDGMENFVNIEFNAFLCVSWSLDDSIGNWDEIGESFDK